MSKSIILFSLVVLVLSNAACNNSKQNYSSNEPDTIYKYIDIVEDSNKYLIEPVESPIVYYGVPNIIQFDEQLADSVYIIFDGEKIILPSDIDHFMLIPNSFGDKTMYAYKKFGQNDSCLVYEKVFVVKPFPVITTNLSDYKEIDKKALASFEKLEAIVYNLSIDIQCDIISFNLISNIDDNEVIEKSDGNKFSKRQIDLIDKTKSNHHIIFTDIIAVLPNGETQRVSDFIIKVK